MVCKDGRQEPLAITWVWQKWGFTAKLSICTFYELFAIFEL
jgi:hypothetical protein